MRMPQLRRLASIVVLAALFVSTGVAAAAEAESFKIVLLPDTQHYSEKHPETYLAQTKWIRQRAKPDNIKFVIHLGDVVQIAKEEKQWQVADAAHKLLDGVVPYSMVPGNHDMDWKKRNITYDTKLYDKYFPPARFETCPWYGGHMGRSNSNNYCFFEGGGMKFMVVSLEFAPRDTALAWADYVVKAHPDRRVIVATHYYLRPQGRAKDPKPPYGLPGNVGEDLWNKYIRKNANITMVVCGHVSGVYHQTSVNDIGKPVHEILCDYQSYPNGGDGWLQTLRFVPAENKITVEAYSPLLDKYNKDPMHTYTLDDDMSPAELKKAG